MTGDADSGEKSREDSASLRLSAGRLSAPVLCRVVSMMLARADCPLDRLDDAMLICDALCAHARAHVCNDHLVLAVTVHPGRLQLRVSELSEHGARGLVRDAVLPEIGNVLEHMTSELRFEPSSNGGGEDLVLGMNFA